jgi:hypothetical protein
MYIFLPISCLFQIRGCRFNQLPTPFNVKTDGRPKMKCSKKNQTIKELEEPIYRTASQHTLEEINFYLARGRYMQSAYVVNLLGRWWGRLRSAIEAGAGGCAGEYGLQGELAGQPLIGPVKP